MKYKDMHDMLVEDWLQIPRKSSKGSIVWKALVQAFPLVCQWMGWRIGNRRKVRVAEYPWMGVENDYSLFYPLVYSLHSNDSFSLEYAKGYFPQATWRSRWKLEEAFGLVGIKVEKWNH
jgi:hypothetical protein